MRFEFQGKVAIVTGAGRGLGRLYALELAKRGASVFVNDLNTPMNGEESSQEDSPAHKVVKEIEKFGGIAYANTKSVLKAEEIINECLSHFGKIDILINNAGILRDVSFHKMTHSDWKALYQVHLQGSYAMTRAVWSHFRSQMYGRVLFIASAAGLYGNFGQAAYSACKLGLVGFCRTLAKEGQAKGIHCNVIAPLAVSRLTESVFPAQLKQALLPDYVAPLACYLCHETCVATGQLYEVGAGWCAQLRLQRSQGMHFNQITPELIQSHYNDITDFSKTPTYPTSPQESLLPLMEKISKPVLSSRAQMYQALLAHEFAPVTSSYTKKDAMLYAIGIGMPPTSLQYVYENDAKFQVFPSFGVLFGANLAEQVLQLEIAQPINPMAILHGKQQVQILSQFPVQAVVETKLRVAQVYDKGEKGAVLVLEALTKVKETQHPLCRNVMSLFLRGMGEFGGDRGPKSSSAIPLTRPPDLVYRETIAQNQAILYRLSGDYNPLHVDPSMAAMVGFQKPILHGLCTMGMATRAVVQYFGPATSSNCVRALSVQFSNVVVPGQTLVTEMWSVPASSQVLFQCRVAETGKVVLTNGQVEFGALTGDESIKRQNVVFAATPVFERIAATLSENLVEQVGAIYEINVEKENQVKSWTIDLAKGKGTVGLTKASKTSQPHCTLNVEDEDFIALVEKKLDPTQAFLQGKLKVQGDLSLARKFDQVLAKL